MNTSRHIRTTTTTKSISKVFTDNINVEIPRNASPSILIDSLKSIKENQRMDTSDTTLSNADFQHLLELCYHNKKDLADQMFTQYQQSDLSPDEYLRRTSLFPEIGINTNITNMFKHYIIAHEKHIYKPLPKTKNQLPATFVGFNDSMDIIVQYMIKFQNIIEKGFINASAAHFDTYFIPPNRRCEFENIRIKGMAWSKPETRINISGLNAVESLFYSKKAKKIMNGINDCRKRLILMVVRGNEDDTNNDILYLCSQSIKGDLRQKRYEFNEVLWNINSKQDIICNNQYKNIKTHNLFNLSYHNLFKTKKQYRIYMHYNGFGGRVFKDNIIRKWSMLFKNKNSMNRICNLMIEEFNDFVETDKSIEFGKYLFGLRYSKIAYTNINQGYRLDIPKDVLKDDIPNIREYFIDQKQLYYYLMWTCKMQVIDKQFIHYILREGDICQIAIYNSELHAKNSNNILYVVCALDNNNWTMIKMMTSYEIYDQFGVDYKIDLPIGSRYIHNSFENEINKNIINLKSEIIPISTYSYTYKQLDIISPGRAPKYNQYDINNLNLSIKESINNILSKQNNEISLIPVLKIDLINEKLYCESLIPVKLPNTTSWIAVSYRIIGNKLQISSIYTDCDDILNKSTLVDPNVYYSYAYLKGNCHCNDDSDIDKDTDVLPPDNPVLLKLATDQGLTIDSLNKQIQAGFQREKLLVDMLIKNNNFPVPMPPIIPIIPLINNNNNNNNNNANVNMVNIASQQYYNPQFTNGDFYIGQ